MAKKTITDLQAQTERASELTKVNKMGTVAKTLVDFDSVVVGPLTVQHPDSRIMTGATTAAHGAEQISAVTAAGANRIKTITETGTNTFVN